MVALRQALWTLLLMPTLAHGQDVQPLKDEESLPCEASVVRSITPDQLKVQVTAVVANGAKPIRPPGLAVAFYFTPQDCGKSITLTAGSQSFNLTVDHSSVNRIDKAAEQPPLQTKLLILTSALEGLAVLGLAGVAWMLWRLMGLAAEPAAPASVRTPTSAPTIDPEMKKQISGISDSVRLLNSNVAALHEVVMGSLKPREAIVEQPARLVAKKGAPVRPQATTAPRSSQDEPPVSGGSFEDQYMAARSRSEKMLPGYPNATIVNFADPEALDKDPSALEPLIADKDGLLMIFRESKREGGEAYLAPSLEYNIKWSATFLKKWRSLFDSDSVEGTTLIKAAVVRQEGERYILRDKGRIS